MNLFDLFKFNNIDYGKSFMLLEIFEQPNVINNILKNYDLDDLNKYAFVKDIESIKRIVIVASGSSKNVGDAASYFLEKVTGLPVSVEFASEFAHRDPCINNSDLVIFISQSGLTADTYKALQLAKSKDAITFALTNNPNSKIHIAANYKMEVRAGEEKSIAATKSFTAQLVNLYILALYLADKKENFNTYKKELQKLPSIIGEIFKHSCCIERIANKIKKSKHIVLIGRNAQAYIAKEGALKIKETSYIDANGYPSGEFLHGHFAFVDKSVPIISILDKNDMENYELAINNTKEIVKKRKAPLIIIKSENDNSLYEIKEFKKADYINIADSTFTAILSGVCLQLLAFFIAKSLGRNVDKPRSLKKALIKE